MKKKYKVIILITIMLLYLVPSSVYAGEDSKQIKRYVHIAKQHEKTIEKDIAGEIEWIPVFVCDDVDIEPKDILEGESINKNNKFIYYNDDNKGYIIQYFKVGSKKGYVLYQDGEVINYEVFN